MNLPLKIISLFSSPSQIQFDNLIEFEELMQSNFKRKSSFVLIMGDFNWKNSNWFFGDAATPQGTWVKAGKTFYGLQQLIKTSTYLQNSPTHFHLVYNNPLHLVIESVVHSSASSTCHHRAAFAKMNLKMGIVESESTCHHGRVGEGCVVGWSVIRIRRFPVQTQLGARPGLGTQPRYEAPSALWVENI